ncbi:MAG TPA: hypothetical protein VGH27_02375 [Streptosporangiaceae bacterium]|jgi:hypothetical protein
MNTPTPEQPPPVSRDDHEAATRTSVVPSKPPVAETNDEDEGYEPV